MKILETKSFKLASYAEGDPTSARLALVLPGRLETKDYVHIKSHVAHLAGLGHLTFYRDLPPGDRLGQEQKKFELPYANHIDAAKYGDLLPCLHECTKPKLFLSGLDDKSIRPEMVREAYDAAAQPKLLHELHVGHSYRYSPRIIDEVNRDIEGFLKEYNLE
jgi:pimeloyl-ACP methyl ester carboxylesterase